MAENKQDQAVDETIEEIFDETDVNETQDTDSTESGAADAASDEVAEGSTGGKEAELEQKLKEAEAKYLRLYADFDNYRRRVKLDAEAAQKYRAQSLVTNLLPALDNFERALMISTDNEETKALLQGMNMVLSGIQAALKEEGVEEIKAVGEEFDPHQHQAVMQDNNPDFGSNIVVEELQKGYKLKDRVIRPSMVKVNQ
ncbi:heat shock protein GrpE [Bacillus sp. FJAT-27916]|uniref:nucleotide exchange factor GrpE n=1 Tax=Bacillaceae TaxID=186817 RepID=UPI00067116D9|nr:nucleotide exchange factor GrpE [Bacillus sp. FJAT-27916]KMY43711.1 heat shock protein GrpE [Bacillus sp. FJAT-27916]